MKASISQPLCQNLLESSWSSRSFISKAKSPKLVEFRGDGCTDQTEELAVDSSGEQLGSGESNSVADTD